MISNLCAQSIYTPYAFTNFVGQPGVEGWLDETGTAGRLHTPHGVAVDPAGNVFIADTFNHVIRKVTPAGVMTNTIRKMAPVRTNWVITTLAGCPTGPVGTNDGPGIAARFDGPFGITASQGNIFVADSGNKTIRKLTPTPTGWEVSTFAGTPKRGGSTDGTGTAALFSAPLGLGSHAVETFTWEIRFA